MSILLDIKKTILQIIDDQEVKKPDLYCSVDIFNELVIRSDCHQHPLQTNTLVMLPNIYWSIDKNLLSQSIVPKTNKGKLILQYLDLVHIFLDYEHGTMEDINNIVQEIINNK